MKMNITSTASLLAFKRAQLDEVSEYRDMRRRQPLLRWLFFEVTTACNLRCAHCGSACTGSGMRLSVPDIERVLDDIRENLPETPSIAITSGEPLLHPELARIGSAIHDRGLYWGMTTNATLIDRAAARQLREAHLSTISVSLDGMEASHDRLRHQKGAWQAALNGIRALQDEGFEPQVTSVLHRGNLPELDDLYELLLRMGIRSWRPINMEPIGRALEHEDMLLTPEEYTRLLDYIQEKRFDNTVPMQVTFGCSHYLGPLRELMVRDHYFFCGAGISVASIRARGDICACLDIEDIPALVQGNIHTDRFSTVWRERFRPFRRDRTEDCEKCRLCPERTRCGGDSTHTWDHIGNRPLLCAADMLPEIISE